MDPFLVEAAKTFASYGLVGAIAIVLGLRVRALETKLDEVNEARLDETEKIATTTANANGIMERVTESLNKQAETSRILGESIRDIAEAQRTVEGAMQSLRSAIERGQR